MIRQCRNFSDSAAFWIACLAYNVLWGVLCAVICSGFLTSPLSDASRAFSRFSSSDQLALSIDFSSPAFLNGQNLVSEKLISPLRKLRATADIQKNFHSFIDLIQTSLFYILPYPHFSALSAHVLFRWQPLPAERGFIFFALPPPLA